MHTCTQSRRNKVHVGFHVVYLVDYEACMKQKRPVSAFRVCVSAENTSLFDVNLEGKLGWVGHAPASV
jgi:hypothetical protein